MSKFKAEAVTRIYLGRDRICRCGCAGEYVERGEPMFEKRLERFIKMADTYNFEEHVTVGGNFLDKCDTYMNISYGKDRAMTVYFD